MALGIEIPLNQGPVVRNLEAEIVRFGKKQRNHPVSLVCTRFWLQILLFPTNVIFYAFP